MSHKKHKYLTSRKSFLIALSIGLFVSIALLVRTTPISAAIQLDCPDGYKVNVARADQVDAACADHQTGGPEADSTETVATNPGSGSGGANLSMDCTGGAEGSCGIIEKIIQIINGVSVLVGIVVVIMIIVGGIQYSAAGSDPQKIASAKSKITNALLALLVFIFLYAFLQWVVPGGIF